SEARPITTPTAMSPGATLAGASCVPDDGRAEVFMWPGSCHARRANALGQIVQSLNRGNPDRFWSVKLPSTTNRVLARLGRACALGALAAGLSGCDWIVMKPHGDIAAQQAQLIVTSTLLMLLIIVPVIALTIF